MAHPHGRDRGLGGHDRVLSLVRIASAAAAVATRGPHGGGGCSSRSLKLPPLLIGAFTGTISATSSEVGIFQTVEQAILPQTAPDSRRTWLFAIYNTVANFAGALGSLAAASVVFFISLGLEGADAYRPFFVFYAVVGLINLAVFLTLSDRVELVKVEGERRFLGIRRSRGTVAKLSLLFGLDAFAGGFVVLSLVAYWFHLRWGLSPEALAVLFFWVNVLSGFSLLAAGWLAQRIGLLNTMVFTHLPSNVLLMLIPLMPSAALAVALLLLRMSISQMTCRPVSRTRWRSSTRRNGRRPRHH